MSKANLKAKLNNHEHEIIGNSIVRLFMVNAENQAINYEEVFEFNDHLPGNDCNHS